MIDDAQYEYLIKFFDAGSLDRLKREMKTAEAAVDRLSKKAEGLQAITASLGFGANAKGELAGNSFLRTGGAEAARVNSLTQGRLAKRQAQIAEQVIRLDTDNHNRLKKHYSALQRQQAVELASLSRQDFLNREVTNLKEAQVRAEAAKLRTAIASREFLNNTDGRSTSRLSSNLANAQADEAQAVANAERLNTLAKQNSVIANKRQVLQTKMEASQGRMNAAAGVGNKVQAQREALKFRQLQLDARALNTEKMSTLELAKQKAMQDRLNVAKAKFDVTNAGTRQRDAASLFKIQAQLLANYAAMGLALTTLAFAGKFVVELDREFAQLQAITATTDEAMGSLKDTLIGVSEKTKFTALEVAEAATILGQAGFSTAAIEASIESITFLATAVGADLKTTVDLVTSTLAVFNLRAEEAGNVANVFTSAVNNSKLNLEKLTLGLQYAGNIANEQNISFSELTATLGAMANSGIRAGSTLGTGLRQILTALAAPSEKLQARLSDLGLTTEDVDVKLHGFTGVLSNLQEAGFTTSDALEVLEVRAGAAFAALTNNSSTIEDLRGKFLLSSAAAEANAVQMESLANKGARLKSVFGTLAFEGLNPLLEVSKIAVDSLTFLLSTLNNLGPVVPVLTTTIVALGIAMVGMKVKTMLASTALLGHIQALVATRVTMAATATGAAALKLALGPVGLGIIAITTALVVGKAAFNAFTVSLDELKSSLDESDGRFKTYQQNIVSLDKEIERLTERHFDATVSMQEVNNIALELQQKFADLGANFNFTTGTIQDLVPELERLRDVMLEMQEVELQTGIVSSQQLLKKQRSLTVRQIDLGSTSLNPLTATNTYNLDRDEQVQNFRGRLEAGSVSLKELEQFNQYLTDRLQPVLEDLMRNPDRGGLEQNKALRERNEYQALQGQILAMMETSRDIEDKRVKLTQNSFERDNANFVGLTTGLQADKLRFTELRSNNDKEGTKAFIDEIEARYSGARESFSGQDLANFDASSFTKDFEGLHHTAEMFLKMTDAQIKEQNELHQLRIDAQAAELQNLLKGEKVSQDAISRGTKRETILKLLDEKQAAERAHTIAEIDRSNSTQAVKTAKLEALARSEEAEREKIINAFKKADMASDIEARDDAFKAYSQALKSDIAVQKKRVDSNSSVAEIEAAKVLALKAQSDLEVAEREKLRYDLRHEGARLPYEMQQLNETLDNNREALEISFDNLHEEIRINQTPKMRDALTKLVNSFDEARQAFDQKVEDLQDPVKTAQAARSAMDATPNEGKFSDVHRLQMDRKVEEAEIKAMREEVELLRNERSLDLSNQQAALEAQNTLISEQISESQAILSNYNGGDNSSSMEQAKAAANQLNELNTLQSKVQGEILDKKKEIAGTTQEILNLEREIGIQTGQSAPAQYTWMEGLNAGLQQYYKNLEDATLNSDTFADKVVEVGGTLTDSLGDAFFDIATGAKSVGEAFGDMAKAVIKAILNILAEQVAIFAIKQLFSAFGFTPQSFASGGLVAGEGGSPLPPMKPRGYARGGQIPNLGTTGRDAVPIMAQTGEFVIRNSAVESIGKDRLHALNTLGSAALDRNITDVVIPTGATGSKEVNVYVMAPEEKPSLGPDDVLHIIGQDIATGGQTKQLIKHVGMN